MTNFPTTCYRETSQGIEVFIQITTRAAHNAIEAIIKTADDRYVLKVHIESQPIEGQANRMLLKYLASQFKWPLSNTLLMKGDTGRRKQILFKKMPLRTFEETLGSMIPCLPCSVS
ncbi:MAG: hypothetical protein FJ161_04540 [Gammaproteobacteria bacterium]|nr:hypothetical protein [Gammaproteobacteria bacterium]